MLRPANQTEGWPRHGATLGSRSNGLFARALNAWFWVDAATPCRTASSCILLHALIWGRLFSDLSQTDVRHLRQSRSLERLESLNAVGGVTLVLNADLRGQKPTLAEQIGVCLRFYQRFSAFQNTELSNSLSPPAEPGVYQCNQEILQLRPGMLLLLLNGNAKDVCPNSLFFIFTFSHMSRSEG